MINEKDKLGAKNGTNDKNIILDSYKRPWFYVYTEDVETQISIHELIGVTYNDILCPNIEHFANLISTTGESIHLVNPLSKDFFAFDYNFYEGMKEDLLKFLSIKIPLTIYNSNIPINRYSEVENNDTMIVMKHQQLMNFYRFNLDRQVRSIKESLKVSNQSFCLFDGEIQFTQEEILLSRVNDLFNSNDFSRFKTLTCIEKNIEGEKEEALTSSFIVLLLELLFEGKITLSEFETDHLRIPVKEFFEVELKKYRKQWIYAVITQIDFQLEYLKEGFIHAIHSLWGIDLSSYNEYAMSEEYVEAIARLETEVHSEEKEHQQILHLLKANPINSYVWTYLYGVHPDHKQQFDEILLWLNQSIPTEADIKKNFCLSVIPYNYRFVGISGVLDYLQTLSEEECLELQTKVMTALDKYEYESHETGQLINSYIKELQKSDGGLWA